MEMERRRRKRERELELLAITRKTFDPQIILSLIQLQFSHSFFHFNQPLPPHVLHLDSLLLDLLLQSLFRITSDIPDASTAPPRRQDGSVLRRNQGWLRLRLPVMLVDSHLTLSFLSPLGAHHQDH